MHEYSELIKKRRAVRDFEDKKVSMSLLNEILSDTCMAPSASNTQPWRFIIIQDKKLIKRISDDSKRNLVAEIEANPQSALKPYENRLRDKNFNVFYNASCLVFIVGKNNYDFFHQDCTLAAAYFMIAATERDLGTCWVGLGEKIKDPNIKNEINLPNDYEVAAAIIVGYPKNIPNMSKRNPPVILSTNI
jgi:nitroreductase